LPKLFGLIVLLSVSLGVKADGDICTNIQGLWKQTHISSKLDKDLVEDSSQSWIFSPDMNAQYKGFIDQEFPYACQEDILTFKAIVESRLKVVRSSKTHMVWESIDFGGFIYVER
jgi:hypothetical protein